MVPRRPAIPVEDLDLTRAIMLNNQSNRIATGPVSSSCGKQLMKCH